MIALVPLVLLAAAGAPAVTASLDTTATSVGGRVTLRLDVEAPEGWFVEPPAPPATLGSFRVRSVQQDDARGPRRAFALTLVPTEAGRQEVPPVTVKARRGSEPPVELATPALAVEVASNLEAPAGVPADSVAVADLKPALAPPRDWRPVWVATAAALVAAALGFLLFRRLRGLRRATPGAAPAAVPRKPARPAWEIALEELDRVAAARWVDRGELRRQYDDVTDALRRYLENRWGVPAPESTTDELRRVLPRSAVPPPVAGRVIALLGEADLVKFAKGRPEPDAARAVEVRARALVQETIPRDAPEEVRP